MDFSVVIEKTRESEYFQFLAVRLAPLVFKVKPAVLLTIKDSMGWTAPEFYSFYSVNRSSIEGTLDIEILELVNNGTCAKVLFYRRSLLEKTLRLQSNEYYLSRCGYDDCSDFADYLAVLKERFNSGSFPHEIGIFLGYPLKDVAGFVSCPDRSKNVGKTPWKVFGRPERSLDLIRRHRCATRFMEMLLLA